MSMHIASLVKIPSYLLKLSSENENMGVSRADNSVKVDEICPLAIPNQTSIISMHIPSLVKIHWCLLKLSSGNEKRMDGRTTDGRTDGQTHGRPSETMIPRHYCVAGYKKAISIFLSILKLYGKKNMDVVMNHWYANELYKWSKCLQL